MATYRIITTRSKAADFMDTDDNEGEKTLTTSSQTSAPKASESKSKPVTPIRKIKEICIVKPGTSKSQ